MYIVADYGGLWLSCVVFVGPLLVDDRYQFLDDSQDCQRIDATSATHIGWALVLFRNDMRDPLGHVEQGLLAIVEGRLVDLASSYLVV